MSSSDVKYFWQYLSNLTFLELQDVVYSLQASETDEFDISDTPQFMQLLATTATKQNDAICEAETKKRERAQAAANL
jgi:hypothetical protein